MKTKSWQQCVDEVGKKYSAYDREYPLIHVRIAIEAAELYREEGIREAIELARGYVFGLDDQIKKEIINRLKA